jgi:hypothetical protein
VALASVQVGTNPAITAPDLDTKHLKTYFTNAIIDTGTGGVVLSANIYEQVIKDLSAVNSSFTELLEPFKKLSAQNTGIDAQLLDFSLWPNITFNFINTDESKNIDSAISQLIPLICSPETYWQINTPSFGKACFRFLSQLPQWPNQSIIGLPLLNNYYVVFDRTEDKTGVVKFAQQKVGM